MAANTIISCDTCTVIKGEESQLTLAPGLKQEDREIGLLHNGWLVLVSYPINADRYVFRRTYICPLCIQKVFKDNIIGFIR